MSLTHYEVLKSCLLFLLNVDRERRDGPSVVELAGGLVEEEKMKGHDWCLKLSYGAAGDKLVFLAFGSQKECTTWFTKCVKVCICRLCSCISLLMLIC